MKKIFLSALVCIMFVLGVSAYAENVDVQIPTFSTEIDYSSVDNRYVEYPLIVYKDITYFPMTYDLCLSFNLMVGFTLEDGLYITSQPVDYYLEDAKPYGNAAYNSYGEYYSATIPTYPIYLNGKRIYNEAEEYPLLNFRGVTYFPMTWRFAYEELGFELDWSNVERSFKVRVRGGGNSIYPTVATDKGVEFAEHVPSDYKYYRCFLFDYVNKTLSAVKYTDETETDGKLYDIQTPTPTVEMKTEIKDNAVYADGYLLMKADGDEKITYAWAYKTSIGSDSYIVKLHFQLGDAPAPYTDRGYHVFVLKDGAVRKLDIDELYSVGGAYDMGDKVYITTTGYRPSGSSRWSNRFSDVFVYNKNDGTLISLVEQNKDKFNSIRFLGYTDGKIYVEAMWYNGDKSMASMGSIPTFSAVNGGFYSVDVNAGNRLTKLYSYIKGETFVFPDGNLYCVASYSIRPILVNLCTGEMYKFN